MKKISKKIVTVGTAGSDIVAIETKKIKLNAAGAVAFENLSDFDWVLFTSKNAVRYFIEELAQREIQLPKSIKIGAVGSQTAKAAESIRGNIRTKINLIPEKFSGQYLAKALAGKIKNVRILFPRSAIAPNDTVRALRSYGAKVTAVLLYTTVSVNIPRSVILPIEKGDADYLVFMSPSGIKGFMKNVIGAKTRKAIRTIPIVCIGPRTSSAAKAFNFKKIYIAETYSRAGIARLLRKLP